jgi:3-hydroxyisobutyrate dehydrogenase
MQVGFIGLGHIGQPMANNLLKSGFKLTVHDIVEDKAQPLLDSGAVWADSPGAVAEVTDVIITSVPGPPETREIIEGNRGILAGVRHGSTWIETSTTDLNEMKRLSGLLAAKGVKTLEAPITGGVPKAWEGKVTMFVAGEKSDFESVLPVFEGIGDKIYYMGPLGAGLVTKLITNMLSFVHHVALGEGLMMGAKAGIDLWSLRDAIQASYGASFACEEGAPQIFDGSYNPNFSLDLTLKDFDLAIAFAGQIGAAWGLIPHVREYYEQARRQYGGNSGLSSVVRLTEDAVGLQLRAHQHATEVDEQRL